MKVLILGCGPAGLMAAQAVESQNGEAVIISRKEKSFIGGAQYLHRPIPGITPEQPEGQIEVGFWGTKEGYAAKVYGNPDAPVSWTRFFEHGPQDAWDIRKAYDLLWEKFGDKVIPMDLVGDMVERLLQVDSYDHVFSAVPAPVICRHKAKETKGGWKHTFEKQKVLIHPEFPTADMEYDLWLENYPNFMLYNGNPADQWYRASHIFGVSGGTEYPLGAIVAGARAIGKPLTTNCNCWNGITKLGRYGVWNKNLLSHHGYEEAMKVVAPHAVH